MKQLASLYGEDVAESLFAQWIFVQAGHPLTKSLKSYPMNESSALDKEPGKLEVLNPCGPNTRP